MDAVITIETKSFDHPWKRPSITGELQNQQARAFILIREKQSALRDMVAYIFLRILMDEVHILKLAAAPDRRDVRAYPPA